MLEFFCRSKLLVEGLMDVEVTRHKGLKQKNPANQDLGTALGPDIHREPRMGLKLS